MLVKQNKTLASEASYEKIKVHPALLYLYAYRILLQRFQSFSSNIARLRNADSFLSMLSLDALKNLL